MISFYKAVTFPSSSTSNQFCLQVVECGTDGVDKEFQFESKKRLSIWIREMNIWNISIHHQQQQIKTSPQHEGELQRTTVYALFCCFFAFLGQKSPVLWLTRSYLDKQVIFFDSIEQNIKLFYI